jgi:ribokinase
LKRFRIFLFGDINLDVTMLVPEIPPPGQDAYVDRLLFNLGGSATNTSVALSQLGLEPRLLGSVGVDPNAAYLINALESFGIETSAIRHKSDSPSGQIFLTVLPDGERTMYSFRGANVLTSPEDIPSDLLDTVDLIHLSGYVFLKAPQRDTALKLIEIACKKNIPISMDTGMDPVLHAHAEMKPAIKQMDILICGQREGALLTGKDVPDDIIRAFFDLGIQCAAIKLGTQGCVVGLKGEIAHLPALVISAVDTTGSGDAFSAGILISWLNQSILPEMCMLANSLGAYAATQVGPISTNLSIPALVEFLKISQPGQSPGMQRFIERFIEKLSINNHQS